MSAEADRPRVTAWLQQGGLQEAVAIQVAEDEGWVWADLPEDEKDSYRATAGSAATLISEWPTEDNR